MKKNIVVVGCGHWGKNLVRNFYELGVLGGVCDPDSHTAQSFADLYDVKSMSYEETLHDANIDGVVLAVPAQFHAPMAIQAFGMGKHVYVEKPLAMNQNEAENIIAAATKSGKHLMVGHLLQYHPAFLKLRSLVSSNVLGKLSYVYSNRLSLGKVRSEEDVIWSFAPHDISMILSLANSEPSCVRAESTKILQPNIADIATIHMEFPEGLKAHVFVSWLHPYKEQKIVVIGNKGMAVFDDTLAWNEKLTLYKHSLDMTNTPPLPIKSTPEYVQLVPTEPLASECQYFIDLMADKVPPLTDGDEGLRVLKVLTAATKS